MNLRASIVFCLSLLPVPAVAQSPIPSHYFGMHHNYALEWPTFHVGSRRSIVGPNWGGINPAEGTYNWQKLDNLLSALETRNADLLFNLGIYMPNWASSQPGVYCPDGNYGTCYPPKDMQTWETWVSAIVAHVREGLAPGAPGRIKYWELWNEPNDLGWWRGDMATMVDLARRAYRIIKAADPSAKIVTPGVYSAPWGGSYDGAKWTIDFLSACSTGDPCADIVAFHAYPSYDFSFGDAGALIAQGVIDPQAFPLMAEQSIIDPQKYKNIAATFGLEAVWNTEGGLSVWTNIPNATIYDVADPQTVKNWDLMAQYAVKATMLMQAGGVERSYWYAYDNRLTGLLWQWSDDLQGTALNPAGVAYGLMAAHFNGATPVSPVARQEMANAIRNPTASGAVVGQPGTMPTHWSVYKTDPGVNTAVVEAGSGYVDVRVWGTPSYNGLTYVLFEEAGVIASSLGKQWFGSFNQRLVGGSLDNVQVHVGVYEFSPGGPLTYSGAQTVPPTTLDHTLQRNLFMTPTRYPATASLAPVVAFQQVAGQAFDITLRLSSPHFDDGTRWIGTYSKPDNSSLILAWDSSGATSTLTVDPAYTQYQDLAGAFHPVSGNSVPLTLSPVFIIAGAP
ncbi:MAG: cellulase family glycosylhydrolase [Methylacidiphilales bacterium]|nr:cellulase family glycosylhydrolase [Candidatus Methylacidiphilales bacterium]